MQAHDLLVRENFHSSCGYRSKIARLIALFATSYKKSRWHVSPIKSFILHLNNIHLKVIHISIQKWMQRRAFLDSIHI